MSVDIADLHRFWRVKLVLVTLPQISLCHVVWLAVASPRTLLCSSELRRDSAGLEDTRFMYKISIFIDYVNICIIYTKVLCAAQIQSLLPPSHRCTSSQPTWGVTVASDVPINQYEDFECKNRQKASMGKNHTSCLLFFLNQKTPQPHKICQCDTNRNVCCI